MIPIPPKYLLLIAFFLLVLGVALPVLMSMQMIESTFFLNFFSFGVQLVGLILGFIGAFSLVIQNRNRRDR